MNKTIVVAGANGKLGQKICQSLIEKGATVFGIVTEDSPLIEQTSLEKMGVKVFALNYSNIQTMSGICLDAHCVVSAVNGLQAAIIDAQSNLVHAAVSAGVKRFIPSDYSLDFTRFEDGDNRNLDLKRSFHRFLDSQAIACSSIFCGVFTEYLGQQFPMIDQGNRAINYWGDSWHEMGFTSIGNVAECTAELALEEESPRYLRITGDSASPRDLMKIMSRLTDKNYRLNKLGSINKLEFLIKVKRIFSRNKELHKPEWQNLQYQWNMLDHRASHKVIDNPRFPNIVWQSVEDILGQHLAQKSNSEI